MSNFNSFDLALLATTAVEPIEVLEVRQLKLRHHLLGAISRALLSSAPIPHPPCASPCVYALLGARADRVLIGAWNPTLWPNSGLQGHFGVGLMDWEVLAYTAA